MQGAQRERERDDQIERLMEVADAVESGDISSQEYEARVEEGMEQIVLLTQLEYESLTDDGDLEGQKSDSDVWTLSVVVPVSDDGEPGSGGPVASLRVEWVDTTYEFEDVPVSTEAVAPDLLAQRLDQLVGEMDDVLGRAEAELFGR